MQSEDIRMARAFTFGWCSAIIGGLAMAVIGFVFDKPHDEVSLAIWGLMWGALGFGFFGLLVGSLAGVGRRPLTALATLGGAGLAGLLGWRAVSLGLTDLQAGLLPITASVMPGALAGFLMARLAVSVVNSFGRTTGRE